MSQIDCSLKGYKQLSPLFARVKLYGKDLTIKEHLDLCQQSMIVNNTTYSYLSFANKELDPKFLFQIHCALWVKYFDVNPSIEKFIRDNGIRTFISEDEAFYNNEHLDIITKFIRIGRYAVVRDFKELKEVLSNDNYSSYKNEMINTLNSSTTFKISNTIDSSKCNVEIKNRTPIKNSNVLEGSISIMNRAKPIKPEKLIRVFNFGREKFKIVENNSKIMAFKVKRSNYSVIPVSIFEKNNLKNVSLNTIHSTYQNILDKSNYEISQKSIKAISKEVYNYINKK